MLLRMLLALVFALFLIPWSAMQLGNSISEEIKSTDSSSIPWRRSRLLYRVAKFSPFFWSTAKEAEHQADLKLSDNFFVQVLRGEQDAIVPEDHLRFLEGRPDTEEWKNVRMHTLLEYGYYEEILSLSAQINDAKRIAPVVSIAALYSGDAAAFSQWMSQWEEPPEQWKWLVAESTYGTERYPVEEWQNTYDDLSETDRPVYLEHLLSTGFALEEVSSILAEHPTWVCPNLMLANLRQDTNLLRTTLENISLNNLYLSFGTMITQTICHADRFEDALDYAEPTEQATLWLLAAHTQITQYQISKAQKSIKRAETLELTQGQRVLALHLRTIARELAGDPDGMIKYAEIGAALDKPLFSIAMARAHLYQQSKTTALQILSSLNGYPIPEQLQQEYTDMWVFARRLNGAPAKITIGNHDLAYDFMDNDGDFRSWLVQYISENADQPVSTHLGLIILRFWRGEDKHSDQLLRTNMDLYASPTTAVVKAHQRFLLASLRNNKELKSKTWKSFSKTREWLAMLPYPQMLRTHHSETVAKFPRAQ